MTATVYQIEAADGGYPTPGEQDREAGNSERAASATDWRPATVCGIGRFDSAETAAVVIRDHLHNYAPVSHAGQIATDRRVLRAVAVASEEPGASEGDYEAARRRWIGGDSGIARPNTSLAEVSPEVFHAARSAGIEG